MELQSVLCTTPCLVLQYPCSTMYWYWICNTKLFLPLFVYCCHSQPMFCNRYGKTYGQTSLIGCSSFSFHFYIWTPLLKFNFYGKNLYNYLYLLAIQGTFLLLSSNRWSNLSVPEAHQRGKIIGRKRKNGVVTCVAKCFANFSMAPFQIPCTI